MILQAYKKFLAEPLAFWIANSDRDLIPEIVRSIGIAPVTDCSCLTVFVPEVFSHTLIKNLATSKHITLTGTSVPTYESYQFKGVFISIRLCTEEEVQRQRKYMDGFTDEVAHIGFSKEGFFNSYFHQPSYAITFRVMEVFEQTPHKNTGKLVIREDAHE
jgi:hypothetical protein